LIILGISAFFHDSAAAILDNGKLVAAAQEERFTRKKNDASFPVNSIKFCLEYSGYSVNDLDAIVFYDKPFLKFERLLETYYAFAPKGLRSFLTSMPVWMKEKLFLKKIIRSGINSIEKADWNKIKLLFPEHHLSHAASAFYPSPFQNAAILTIDGVGEWATTTICEGNGKSIKVLKEIHFPHSLGLLYSAFTYFCGFSVNSGEYKLMGLAPYGMNSMEQVKKFVQLIKKNLVEIIPDGSFFMNQDYFGYATGLRMVNHKKWKELFGFDRREPGAEISQQYAELALAIQLVTEEIIMNLANEAKRLTGSEYLCMAGGVALNGVAAGKLLDKKIFKDIFVQPAAGDAGGAVGAAYAAYHIYYNRERNENHIDKMEGCYLGPEYSSQEIIAAARSSGCRFEVIDDENVLIEKAAHFINEGKVIGWFQGRMEFGPRALGSRSILADARNSEMQQKLNMAIKFRESFRPFAPIVPEEDVSIYFEHDRPSPYMMFVKPVKSEWRDKLPSVTHIDGTARLQTVSRESNLLLWKLLIEFKRITGCSVMINTSFNVKDEPIVNTPMDACHCFINTGMDHLIAGNIIISKITTHD
jgi:carbamoyltransferase